MNHHLNQFNSWVSSSFSMAFVVNFRGMLRPPVHPTNHELAAKPWLQHLRKRWSSVPICTCLKESLSNQISSVIYTYIILYVYISYMNIYDISNALSYHIILLMSIGCTMMYWAKEQSLRGDSSDGWAASSPSQRGRLSRHVTRHSSQQLSSGLAPLALDRWCTVQWIGLGENLQETPIFNGKNHGFL